MKLNLLGSLNPWNKMEGGGKKPEYNEADLQKADQEYRTAAIELNELDYSVGVGGFDAQEAMKKLEAYRESSAKYQKIHKSLHPEAYLGKNENVVILPNVELTKEARDLEEGTF